MLLAADLTQDFTTPLVSGAIQGAVYGLLGLGLVLLYKGNRIFNFAQGEFGTVAAFLVLVSSTGAGIFPKMPFPVAIVVGLVAGTLMALVTERLVIRPLFRQPKVTMVVATAGVALLAISFELFFNGTNGRNARPIVAGEAIRSGGLSITWQQVVIVGVLATLALASALFFSRTQTGVAILAVSQEPTATSLVGISVNRISALTWGMAGFLGAIAGILLAPTTLFGPGFMTTSALIPGFTAAVFGGITSLPGAFLGGVLIGIAEQFGNKIDLFPGANRVVVFALLLVILLIKPAGLLGKEA
ncbi:MAG TPA: branched-chain amino acid ABC transporter permease [Mycobacteriales bacterium]|nr:branched-chain amino acid ABC transporter permease [Mycobacteriales bacterium]